MLSLSHIPISHFPLVLPHIPYPPIFQHPLLPYFLFHSLSFPSAFFHYSHNLTHFPPPGFSLLPSLRPCFSYLHYTSSFLPFSTSLTPSSLYLLSPPITFPLILTPTTLVEKVRRTATAGKNIFLDKFCNLVFLPLLSYFRFPYFLFPTLHFADIASLASYPDLPFPIHIFTLLSHTLLSSPSNP